VQEAVANSRGEIAQLRATGAALREALERARIVHAEAVETVHAQHQAEIAQLQATVRELRAQLDASVVQTRGAG